MRALLGVVCAAVVSNAAVAQTTALPTSEELDPSRLAQPLQRQPSIDPFLAPTRLPCPFAGSELRFKLNSVEVAGATAATRDELVASYAHLVGTEVPVTAACEIRDRIAELYFSKGILARAEIPEQTIADGKLKIEVIEAHIAQVRVTGAAGPARRKVEQYLGRLRGLAPFDLNVVQRYLLLASDLPGVRISTNVRPLPERGAVELEVVVAHDAVDATANLHNYGSRASGRWNGLVRLDLNSLTGLGERTSITAYASSDLREQRLIQLIEEARFRSEGLVGRLSLAYSEGRPSGALAPLNLETQSFVGSGELLYPLVRMRRRNLAFATGLDWVDQKTEFAASALTNDQLRVAFARLQGNLLAAPGDVPLSVGGTLELRKGLSALGASEAGSGQLSRLDADPSALIVKATGQLQVQAAPNLSFELSAEAQTSNGPLLSYEEMTVGNFTIGRGYDAGAVSGDRGVAGSIEMRFGPFELDSQASAGFYAFYDAAWVDNLDVDAASDSVGSVGGGIRLQLGRRANLDIAYAHPLSRLGIDSVRPSPRLLVNLVTRFH